MNYFFRLPKPFLYIQLALLVGCGGSAVPVSTGTNSSNGGTTTGSTGNTTGGTGSSSSGSGSSSGSSTSGGSSSSGSSSGSSSSADEEVREISIEYDKNFTFAPDTGDRADKVVGTFQFSLKNVDTGRYIRDLDNSHMTFKERTLGSSDAFAVEVEATQSSSIETTPIDVMYLIDNSYSVVQSGANTELLTQANKLASAINVTNGSSTTQFRTFADSVGGLNSTNAADPFSSIAFEEQGGGTALYEGIQTALMDLSSSAHPVLFVFTDGRENASSQGYSLDLVLSTAINYNIPVYIAALGNVDRSVLTRISSETGGQFFQADSVDELSDTFENILYSIPAEYTVTYRPTQRTGQIEFQFVVDYGGASDSLLGDFDVDAILGN